MSEPPPDWIRTTLGELGHYWNGRGFKKREWRETGRPIIRIQNLTGSGSTFNYFQGDVDERHVAHAGDLLVSWAATLGVFEWKGPEAVINQHIFKVDSFIDRRFHRYLLEYVLDDLQAKAHGSGMVHITRKRFDETPVQIPESLDEQRRIVEAIEEEFSRLDAGVQSLRRAKQNLIRMQASVFETAVRGDLGGLSLPGSSWPMVPLAIALEELRYGTSTKCSHDGEGKPVLRIPNVRDGQIVLSDLKSAIDPDVDLSRVTAEEGDVLFIRTNGSRDLIGRVGVVTKEAHGMAFASYLIGGRPSPELDSRFLWIVLSSPTWRRRIEGLAATSAGQYNISASKLKTIQIPLPPMTDQQEIVAEVDRQSSILGVVSDAIATAKARAHRLRRTVLREAFASRLVSAETSLDVANA